MKRHGPNIRHLTYLLLGAAVALAACGGDDESAQQAATDATAVTLTLGTEAPVDTVPPQDRYSDVTEGTELSDAVTASRSQWESTSHAIHRRTRRCVQAMS